MKLVQLTDGERTITVELPKQQALHDQLTAGDYRPVDEAAASEPEAEGQSDPTAEPEAEEGADPAPKPKRGQSRGASRGG